ncbi:MAG: SUMF1/EgtB/PvdO family nonheme iron enzyme [Planctomycetota bacterium]
MPKPQAECNPQRSEAEALFVAFVASREAGQAADFHVLCQEHPDLADELKSLHQEWERISNLLDLAVERVSLSEQLERSYGEHVDPEVLLDERHGKASGQEPSRCSDSSPEKLVTRGRSGHQYEVRGRIGKGGMGVVLRVWDADLRRHLAMKVIRITGAAGVARQASALDRVRLRRFLAEAQVTGQLDHPGVVPVHELGLDAEGRAYFTMRLVKGKTLKEIFEDIRQGREEWTQTRALNVIMRACEAMAYAHAREVIHRDLKPANIMAGRFGETYVMDWGLAKVLDQEDLHDIRLQTSDFSSMTGISIEPTDSSEDRLDKALCTMDGDVVGTPAYMAPEQARGAVEEVGPRADVYSMGAVLYHLLAGHSPYVPRDSRMTPHTILAAVGQGPPQPLHEINPKLSPELVAICEKAMSRAPADRYADMIEMAEDLRAYLENRVVRAYRTGAGVEFRKWVERNRGMAAAIGVALVLALGGLAGVAAVQSARRAEIAQKNLQLEETNRQLTDLSSALGDTNTELVRANKEIREARDEATASAVLAQARLQDYERMADVKRVQDLTERAQHELWPRRPEKIELMVAWIEAAQEVAAHLPEHRLVLARLEENGSRATGELGFEGNTSAAWQHQVLTELVSDLESLLRPETGLIDVVRGHLQIAKTIEGQTIDERADEWAWAIEDIVESRWYGGLELDPQVGLIPLEPDPSTGLWEFWVWETGERPVRDEETGRWRITGETGLVLTLLPAATFFMGATRLPAGPNYDPDAGWVERLVRPVSLDAFFISKYEVTQGQWLRLTGENPSAYAPGFSVEGVEITLAHPVEKVSWPDCVGALARLGLVLPTEAQWEYAARAGTDTPWYTGRERETLRGAANVADEYCKLHGGMKSWVYEEWADGYLVHAPVGTFRPNNFGLHDMHGNVWEWCLDTYGDYRFAEPRPRDGLLEQEDWFFRVARGGGFRFSAIDARSANRLASPPGQRDEEHGLRPARAIDSE